MGSRRAADRRRSEFGDFQTPMALARAATALLERAGLRPACVLEPTCGEGSFLAAALERFPSLLRAVGVERDAVYLEAARDAVRNLRPDIDCELRHQDFFATDWATLLSRLPDPLLVIGNPPWVTNAALGRLQSKNLPPKRNAQQLAGIEALTGRSNFDISEWMLMRSLEWMVGREATLAVLCKTAVARKLLEHAWLHDQPDLSDLSDLADLADLKLAPAELYRIDAAEHFGASVDAGFLVVSTTGGAAARECAVHTSLGGPVESTFGLRDGKLVADVAAHARWAHLAGKSARRWRSGIKHDCARVMELREEAGELVNGFGEPADIEPDFVFPLRKSSQLAAAAPDAGRRFMLVPQRTVGEDTSTLAKRAPRTWAYLRRHGERLDARRSRIYRGRPRFSVFGVGAYSFAPWKLAVSGFYRPLHFRAIGPAGGKPVVFDDTCYALPCASEQEAKLLLRLFESKPAQQFLGARVFWDAKRPVTVGLLGQLDIAKLAAELGCASELERFRNLTATAGGGGNRTRHR